MTTMPRRRRTAPERTNAPRVTEKQWQAQVIQLARMFGWFVFWTWNSRHSPAGEPDLRLLRVDIKPAKHVGRYVLAELKTDTGKLSEAQQDVANKLWCCDGIEFYIWRPKDIEEVIRVLR